MIRIDGSVKIEAGTQTAILTGEGSRLVLDVSKPRDFLRESGAYNIRSRATLKLLAGQLAQQGLTLEIRSRGRAMMLLGCEAKPGLAGWLLGIPHFSLVSPGAAMKLLFGI
jgi:hypothetical protein